MMAISRRLPYSTIVLLLGAAVPAPVRAEGPPLLRQQAEVERVLSAARNERPKDAALRTLNIVLLADVKDHGANEHDYPRWQARWGLLLGGAQTSPEKAANLFGSDRADPANAAGAANVQVQLAKQWPEPTQWDTADLIVAYCYLAWNAERLEQAQRFLGRGGGLVVIHSATWTRPSPSAEVAAVLGVGGFQRWRHGQLELDILQPSHPICAGLPSRITFDDEPYWPPTPVSSEGRVQVLAASQESVETEGSAKAAQAQFWTFEREKGRVFGCVPGHYMWTFDDPYFRILLLRGMAWAAGESPYRFDPLVLRSAAVAEE